MLCAHGIKDILINIHHHKDAVEHYLDNCQHPVKIVRAYENELLGTGGTLLRNSKFFQDEAALVIHADNFSRFNLGEFLHTYESRPLGVEITMLTFETDTPQSCGIVEVDRFGIVQGFHEKVPDPPGRLANGAVYVVSPNVLKFLATLPPPPIDFSTAVIPSFVGRINTYHNATYHRDIGTLDSLARARADYGRGLP
jgi:mannose-1-phosphate guanylyltransferase